VTPGLDVADPDAGGMQGFLLHLAARCLIRW
jgi:hypothetical protein